MGKESVREKTAAYFDLPGDIVAGLPKITVTGCREMYIENHRGILEYGEGRITVNCERTIIKILGTELELRSMSDREMIISGTITDIGFEF